MSSRQLHRGTAVALVWIALVLAVVGCTAPSTTAPAAEPTSSPTRDPDALLAGLRAGGHLLFVRHAEAGDSETEGDPAACGGPLRSLNDLGRAQAAQLAEGFAAAQIPIGSVTTSRACRTLVTAESILAELPSAPPIRQDPAVADGDGLRQLVLVPPAAGTNDLVVGHSSPFEEATGIDAGARGTTVILRQDQDNRFVEVARLTPEQWADLIAAR